ncbi:hypothetical protein ACE01N_11940 [Saccharicrinis sp. FJH2]|uniref:hypothetical protein n=1 Tax=Saccharicrinis sp. FJH65 TaxID=3344659 RepID=UPI0035F4EEBE
MKALVRYIKDVLGLEVTIKPLGKHKIIKFPIFLNEGYNWYEATLAGRQCIFAKMKKNNAFSIAQIEKHFELVRTILQLPIIVIFDSIEAYNRKRLVEKHIAFMVPNKQMYVPEFLIDLREYGFYEKKKISSFTPVAQQLVLIYILNKHEGSHLENFTFKDLATFIGANQMGITRAVENLKFHKLIDVTGEKEKYIHFLYNKKEIWNKAEKQNLLINPVLKRIYSDQKPQGIFMLSSNSTALAEYSDLNPSLQEFYAIDKSKFYAAQKSNVFVNANEHEGNYCIEVWKYDPEIIVKQLFNKCKVVDPLSLYLCFKNNTDERIEMALEQLIEQIKW